MQSLMQYTATTSAAVFEQLWPAGANGTQIAASPAGADMVLSAFPSFNVDSIEGEEVGFFGYAGSMVGSGTYSGESWRFHFITHCHQISLLQCTGVWGKGASIEGGGRQSGPLILFNSNLTSSLVVSSFSNFMAHSYQYSQSASVLSYGVMGSVTSIPIGYSLETVLYAGQGVNSVMLGWGDMLLAKYGKQREAFKRDFTLNYLGYRYAGKRERSCACA